MLGGKGESCLLRTGAYFNRRGVSGWCLAASPCSEPIQSVGGIASAAYGLNRLQQFLRSPLEAVNLAGELRLASTMCRSILGGCHLTFELKRRCLHPVNIGFDGCTGQAVIESVSKSCDGLPGERFGPLSFSDPEFKLGTGFRWERRAGLRVNGTTAGTSEAKHQQQQNQGATAPHRPAIGGLTDPVQLT